MPMIVHVFYFASGNNKIPDSYPCVVVKPGGRGPPLLLGGRTPEAGVVCKGCKKFVSFGGALYQWESSTTRFLTEGPALSDIDPADWIVDVEAVRRPESNH